MRLLPNATQKLIQKSKVVLPKESWSSRRLSTLKSKG